MFENGIAANHLNRAFGVGSRAEQTAGHDLVLERSVRDGAALEAFYGIGDRAYVGGAQPLDPRLEGGDVEPTAEARSIVSGDLTPAAGFETEYSEVGGSERL